MPINMSTLDSQFRFRPALNGGGLRTKIYPEAAGCDFRYGEPVVFSSSGGIDSVTQIATSPSAGAVSASLAASTLIVGFALANATGVTGTPVPILLCSGAEVLTRVANATTPFVNGALAEVRDVTVGDYAELFRIKGLTGGTDVFMVVSDAPNGTDGINKAVIVEKYSLNQASVNPALIGDQAVTDTFALVWVAIRPSLSTQAK